MRDSCDIQSDIDDHEYEGDLPAVDSYREVKG